MMQKLASTARRKTPTSKTAAGKTGKVKKPDDDATFVTSLARGLSLLRVFTQDSPKLTFMEVCDRTELPRTTVHRLLNTLAGLDYLVFDEETRRYFPGPSVTSLGLAALNALDIREKVRPFLISLFNRLDETINYSVRDQMEAIVCERIQGNRVIAVDLKVGARITLYDSSMGRCLIAFLPAEERERLLAEMVLPASAAGGMVRLRQSIADALKDGYTLSDQDFAHGLLSVAFPVWDSNNRIFAAVNVAVPSFRVSVKDLDAQIIPNLRDTARRISLCFGASEKWVEGGWREII
jgi:IclR family pca regulon transcriptional regulator